MRVLYPIASFEETALPFVTALKLGLVQRNPPIWSRIAVLGLLSCGYAWGLPSSEEVARLRIEISFPESVSPKPLDGHILLGISTDKGSEPRFQLREEEAESGN